MRFSQRVTHLKEEGAYAVLARANKLEAEGRDVIHLEIGQPDFQTFPHIGLAGVRAIAEGYTRYNPPDGIIPLREAIAKDAGERRGIKISRSEVFVCPGAKPILFLPLFAVLEPGDEVIYPDPGFPTYSAAIGVAGAKGVPVPITEETGFSLDMDAFLSLINERTRLVILNSPANPTGGVIPLKDLEKIAQAAVKHDLWVLSDEIYSRFVYEGESAASIATLPGMRERTIILDGFSKTYAMTGWRLGYGIATEELVEKVKLLLNHSVGCTATFTQHAGLTAITGPQDLVDEARARFKERRDLMVAGLNSIPGVTCRMPAGSFYTFPNVKSFGKSSKEVADYLLDEAGVALLPGTDFGPMGEGYLRLCYATSMDEIKEALGRMADALARFGG